MIERNEVQFQSHSLFLLFENSMKLCSISSETENDDVSSGIKGATTDAFLLLFVLLFIQNTDCICRHVRCVHGEGGRREELFRQNERCIHRVWKLGQDLRVPSNSIQGFNGGGFQSHQCQSQNNIQYSTCCWWKPSKQFLKRKFQQ